MVYRLTFIFLLNAIEKKSNCINGDFEINGPLFTLGSISFSEDKIDSVDIFSV